MAKQKFGTRTGKHKFEARAGKYKFGARAGKHKLGARIGKYKLGARAGKYKSGARTGKYKLAASARGGGQAKGWGPGNRKTPTEDFFISITNTLNLIPVVYKVNINLQIFP